MFLRLVLGFYFCLIYCNRVAVCSTTTLHLLALVPLGNTDKNVTNCYDLGEELIPAAKIAAERINSNSDLLGKNYSLEIIPAKTDRCLDPSIGDSLASFVNYSTNSDLNIVGIIGLTCGSATLGLSSIASRREFNIIQITASTSPPGITRSRKETVDLLYQTAPSSTIFNEAMIALMKDNGWREISVIRHTDSVSVEHDFIANDLQKRISEQPDYNVSVYAEIASGLDRIINEIRMSAVRIVYTSVTDFEARELLCRAYNGNASWPDYLWILHDHSLRNLLISTSQCSEEMMKRALEGAVLLYHDTSKDGNRNIDFTNQTYNEYYDSYNRSLHNVTSDPICNKEPQILSANAMYDSVLAFACALNKSIPLNSSNLRSEALNRNLQSVNFSGAGGNINFDNTTHQLTGYSGVNMHQIFDGKLQYLAYYNGSIHISYNSNTSLNLSYTFEAILIRLPLELPIITLVLVVIGVFVTAIVAFLFIYYRNTSDIKATTPVLSYIILFSCFLLYASVGLTAVRYGFATGEVYAQCCISEQWFFIVGMQFIFVTLSVRLLRVLRLFFNVKRIGAAWSDKALILYICAIVSVSIVMLTIWSILNDMTVGRREQFIYDGNPPHFIVELSCNAENDAIFLSLLLGYTGLFMAPLLILAIKTRKVHIDSFKDTRSVNAFVFCSVGILALFIPLSYIFAETNGIVAIALSYSFRVASLLMVAITCISLLFIPKIYTAKFGKIKSSRPRLSSTGVATNYFTDEDGFTLKKNSAYETVRL